MYVSVPVRDFRYLEINWAVNMEVLLGDSPVKSKRRFKKKEHAVLQKCSAVYPKSPQLAHDIVGDVQHFAVFLNERL